MKALLLIAGMTVLTCSCVSELNRTETEVEGYRVPVQQRNYYYLPDQEVYYFFPAQQWIWYEAKDKKWMVSAVTPAVLKDVNLQTVYVVRLDDTGFAPYQFHEANKRKYPPGKRERAGEKPEVIFIRK